MVNLIGDEVNEAARWLTVPGAALHLYGKGEARPGRKMGHVTRLFPARLAAAAASYTHMKAALRPHHFAAAMDFHSLFC